MTNDWPDLHVRILHCGIKILAHDGRTGGCIAILYYITGIGAVQVVAHERPDLQEQAATLVATLGQYTITLTDLEDNLLRRLANSQVLATRFNKC